MTAALATLLQFGYSLVFLAVGAVGIFCTGWELRTTYGFDPAALTDPASFLGQYQFLKAVEFGMGLFGLLMRREILSKGVENLIFQAVVLSGVIARLAAWISYGTPKPVFILIMLLEALTFVFIWLHVSRDPDQA